MNKMLYVVRYSGAFGFIKPWTAVRDSETFSQQFLTPSIVEGIEKKLFPELLTVSGIKRIKGHRLIYDRIAAQQEVIQTRGWNSVRKGRKILFDRPTSILLRGVLINPVLHLAFECQDHALNAAKQHICLCRNEDMLLPDEKIDIIKTEDFNDDERYPGFELIFEQNERSFAVGIDRKTGLTMFGWLKIVGNPIKEYI